MIPVRDSSQDTFENFNPYPQSTQVSRVTPEPLSLPSTPIAELQPVNNTTQTVNVEQIIEKLRDIVSDKTGYPNDMLEMDMDMEADMGIDSIKRLEILGAMQEEFPDLQMEIEDVIELRTLEKVAQFMGRQFSGTSSPRIIEAQTTTPSDPVDHIIDRLRTIISEKTGCPPDMLQKETDLEEDLGVDL